MMRNHVIAHLTVILHQECTSESPREPFPQINVLVLSSGGYDSVGLGVGQGPGI